MDINFCCDRLKTKISSSTVSCEGYEVTNLLSGGPVLQSRGFIAEGFTRPPISIYLKFFCNIDVNHIVLWVEVGRQKSNGIELLVTSESRINEGKPEGNNIPGRSPSSKAGLRVGSCKLSVESGVVFQKYNVRTASETPPNFHLKHFNSSTANALSNCGSMEIKIFSTANSSVPTMKKIEVWGRPSRSCSENVRRDMYKLWSQPAFNSEIVPSVVKFPNVEITSKESITSTSSFVKNSSLPEEFLDPITCNIMAIPMTLPCGKTVDLSTLEKFEASESSWGRGPSDPYTGVPFTQSVFPVPDIALKSRIDQFLMEHGHLEEFKGVGRTIGRGSYKLNQPATILGYKEPFIGEKQAKEGVTPSLSHNFSLYRQYSLSRASVHTPTENCESVETSQLPFAVSKETIGEAKSEKRVITKSNETQERRGTKRKSDSSSTSPSGVLVNASERSKVRTHEDTVEDSLDCALQSVLAGLPSFVKIQDSASHTPQSSTGNISHCSYCLSENCLFSLPCGHVLCRPCLVKKSTDSLKRMECGVCQNKFNSGDVFRFHKS